MAKTEKIFPDLVTKFAHKIITTLHKSVNHQTLIPLIKCFEISITIHNLNLLTIKKLEIKLNKMHDNSSELALATPHVVVVPYPSQGHINPLLQFAKHLAFKGIKATLATTRNTLHSVAPLGNVAVEPISDGFDDGGFSKAGSEDAFLKCFKSNGSKSLSHLIETHQNTAFPVTCVVYDAFLPWALDVAKQFGLHGAAFFTNSATVSVIVCCVNHGSISLPLKPESVSLALPRMPKFKDPDLPSLFKKPESYPAYLAMKLGQFSNLDQADWAFCNSFEDLELEVLEGAMEKWPAKLIGPMVPSAYLDGRIEGDVGYGASLWKPLSSECKEWLQKMPTKSVVYISFGSMVSLTAEQMEELAWGLKESGFRFLWVIRESQMSTLPEWFKAEYKSTSEKGMIVTWCNQLEVLAHTSTACFVTHCGWNSTLEGLSLGIPMVGVPQWSDQLTDAKFIEEVWGIGVRAKEDDKGVVTRKEFQRCLEDVMEGKRSENIRNNASKWRELAKKAISHGGSSDKHIDDFVQHLRCANVKANANSSISNELLGKLQLN